MTDIENDFNVIHYDIRAVTGVTRAACGIDNRMSMFTPWQASNNRNQITCEPCKEKIFILSEYGGDAVVKPTTPEEKDRQWFKQLVKEAIAEGDEENDEDLRSWHKSVIKEAAEEWNEDNPFDNELKATVNVAIAEALAEGKLRFDTKELKEIVESVFTNSMQEVKYEVGSDFMDSPSIKNLIFKLTRDGTELALEENQETFAAIVKFALEEVLKDNPMQFVQNVYSPDNLSASEVYRQTKGLLQGKEDSTPEPKKIVDFGSLSHSQLGDWAIANDLVREWSYDTIMVRRLLTMLQDDGELIHIDEDVTNG